TESKKVEIKKAKPKKQSKKKQEIKPEPVIHLNPSNAAKQNKNINLEKELEAIEKEIEDDLQKPNLTEKVVPQSKGNEKQSEGKPSTKKKTVDDSNMSSLERAMLRSSDNGE
ncbi:MAG: hypothetical protein ACPGJI_05295, partial [Kangiellaceae bacterium]